MEEEGNSNNHKKTKLEITKPILKRSACGIESHKNDTNCVPNIPRLTLNLIDPRDIASHENDYNLDITININHEPIIVGEIIDYDALIRELFSPLSGVSTLSSTISETSTVFKDFDYSS